VPGVRGGQGIAAREHRQVKLLFDQNLSHRLPAALADVLPGAAHVRNHDLAQADDQAVWVFARDRGFTIVSKDDDFRERVRLLGHPPRIIMLQLGNCSTADVEAAMRRSVSQISRLHEDPSASLLAIARDAAFLLLKHTDDAKSP
jgi:predicted nuclease of predicted toxin-antitoxin system